MYCLQQGGVRKVPAKIKCTTVNHYQSRSVSEEVDAVYLSGLEEYCVLRAPFAKSYSELRQIARLKWVIDETNLHNCPLDNTGPQIS